MLNGDHLSFRVLQENEKQDFFNMMKEALRTRRKPFVPNTANLEGMQQSVEAAQKDAGGVSPVIAHLTKNFVQHIC